MWEWWRWGEEKGAHSHHHDHQPLLIVREYEDIHRPSAAITSVAMILTSWLRTHRRLYLLLALCSPFLLPFLCATFPLICAAETCLRFCRLGNRLKTNLPGDHQDRTDKGLSRCKEGGGVGVDEVRLLQRYLEDQLFLVVGSVYDCGNDCDGELEDYDRDGTEISDNYRNSILR